MPIVLGVLLGLLGVGLIVRVIGISILDDRALKAGGEAGKAQWKRLYRTMIYSGIVLLVPGAVFHIRPLAVAGLTLIAIAIIYLLITTNRAAREARKARRK